MENQAWTDPSYVYNYNHGQLARTLLVYKMYNVKTRQEKIYINKKKYRVRHSN